MGKLDQRLCGSKVEPRENVRLLRPHGSPQEITSHMHIRLIAVLAAASLCAAPAENNRIDLARQTKNADLSAAEYTKPFKVGTELPASCSPGEAFFRLGSSSGLYLCPSTGLWTRVSADWGTVGGLLNDQTDLAAALAARALTTRRIVAGEGLTGGGDLTADRTLRLDVQALPESTPALTDYVPVLDSATGSLRKARWPGSSAAIVYNPEPGLGVAVDLSGSAVTFSADCMFVGCLDARNTWTGAQLFLGDFDASGATMQRDREAASEPPACTRGEVYWNTESLRRRRCIAADTWADDNAAEQEDVMAAGGLFAVFGPNEATAETPAGTPREHRTQTFLLPFRSTVTKMLFEVSTPCTAPCALRIVVWDIAGTVRLIDSGTLQDGVGADPSAAGMKTLTFAPRVLEAGTYRLSVASDSADLRLRAHAFPATETAANPAWVNGAIEALRWGTAAPAAGEGAAFDLGAEVGGVAATPVQPQAPWIVLGN